VARVSDLPSSPLRVAVVTPYYDEPLEVLRQAHESVRQQTYPCTHFLIADGRPNDHVQHWTAEHTVLARAHSDNGNTPRGIGSICAANEGFDAIAYLDADNWFHPTHVARMVDLHRRTGALVCTATRSIHRHDGSLMYVDRDESDGKEMVDTSCLFLARGAFRALPLLVMMPRHLAPVCDKVFWSSLRARGYATAHCDEATVAFRTRYAAHYVNVGEVPPPGSKVLRMVARGPRGEP
jgi:glycosyltransferase involved in cell wall biosynthesis